MARRNRNPVQDHSSAVTRSIVEGRNHRAATALLFCATILIAPQALADGISNVAHGLFDGYNSGLDDGVLYFPVSADGSTIVGTVANGEAARWTQAGGLATLGTLNGGRDSTANAVNADGSVVVGTSFDGAAGYYRAFRWTQAGGMQSLGTLNGGSESYATAVNADGSVVAGMALDGNAYHAYRWTQATGMVALRSLTGGYAASAIGISADGSVIVGNTGLSTNGAYRWTATTGIVTLGGLNGGNYSSASGVSGDGSVVVGTASDHGARAFRWTQATGMVNLGTLGSGTSWSMANATNQDGSVVVGITSVDARGQITRAFRWTQATGMITVEQWLRNAGVSIPADMTARATGVSADGSVVVGHLQTDVLGNNNVFIARGPVPVAGSTSTTTAGLMDVTNFQQSLISVPRVSGQLQNADVAINGAHSSPLFMLLDAGQSSAWFTGDGGYASTKTAQGGLGAGEFGFGRGLDDGWTVRLAGGGQYGRMDTPNAGSATFSSGYIAPDVSRALDGGLVATLSGYFNWGKADIRRGYLNGATNDSSFGSAATQTYGIRARLDWQDAFKLASTGISPFVSYTYLNSQMNGYTETGGSFPVRFDSSREMSNAIRIGADAKSPLTDNLALVTRFEYGHRFEKAGAGVSGQILGLSAFTIDGAPVQQDFVRGGIGMSYKLGDGDGLVVLNTSNQTGRNVTWLSASYRMKF